MNTIKLPERSLLESLFNMSQGFVLDFNDSSFGAFFGKHNIDIHGEKYTTDGTSKAKKLRRFWSIESDSITGPIIQELVEYAATKDHLPSYDKELIEKCRQLGKRLTSGGISIASLKSTSTKFNSAYLTQQIGRMESALVSDPSLAIGTAKELVETCCKSILDDHNQPLQGSPEIPILIKATLKVLKLVPDEVPESKRGAESIKSILRSLGIVAHGLAELRNLYGTGHGKNASTSGLLPRHARLATGAASTFVNFLFETHSEQQAALKSSVRNNP